MKIGSSSNGSGSYKSIKNQFGPVSIGGTTVGTFSTSNYYKGGPTLAWSAGTAALLVLHLQLIHS